jgi:hypothetical protein
VCVCAREREREICLLLNFQLYSDCVFPIKQGQVLLDLQRSHCVNIHVSVGHLVGLEAVLSEVGPVVILSLITTQNMSAELCHY